MIKKQSVLILTFSMLAILVATSCKEEDKNKAYTVTQADIDKTDKLVATFTGGDFAHGFSNQALGDSTVRIVYGTSSNIPSSFPVGTTFTKNTFKADKNGNATTMRTASFAMVKREAGYYPDGGDWEYVVMPFDANADYTAHPNGSLDGAGANQGQLASCVGCHTKAGGGDFLFIND